jgi:hypothetical protein
MFHWKHRRSRAALRCAFALIGLVFLTVQFSGKFYTWSSQALFTGIHKTIKPGIHSTDPRVLSLDKRYKAQKTFALLIQPVRHEFAAIPLVTIRCLPQPATHNGSRKTPVPLRGPPVTG